MTQEHLPAQTKLSARNRSQNAEEFAPYVPGTPSKGISIAPFKAKMTRSLRWKILSIALISATALMLYLFLVAKETRTNAALIEDIFQNKYPIQVLMQSSKHSLVLVNRELEDAVITGDEELIYSAEPMAIEFRRNMVAAVSLDSQYDDEILKILDEFETYYSGASNLAKNMLKADAFDDSFTGQGKVNRGNYERVVSSMETFQQAQLDAFAKSVDDTAAHSQKTLVFGLWASLSTAAIVLILALVIARSILGRIHQIVSALKKIAHESDGMKVRIDLDGDDEMTELAHWFNTFIEKLELVTTESTAEIKRIAYTDTLSNLPNRRSLIESVEAVVTLQRDEPAAVMFLDLDNFKPINDQLGHEAGDELIRQAAARLQEIADRFNEQEPARNLENHTACLAGRLGGDEFMVLIPLAKNKELIEAIALEIRDSLLKPFNLHGAIANIGVSIGISRYPQDAQSKDSLIDFSDLAMYEAKGLGKNTYCFYDESIAEAIDRTNRIEMALKNCTHNNELTLLYQAKFDLGTNEYKGAEAFLRWENEELGKLSPHEFIHLAEKSRVIDSIDAWVLNEACRAVASWLDRGINPGRIAINMSAKQIQRPDLMNTIIPIIEQHNIPCEHLEFEITETSALDHMETVAANIREMRARDIFVSMDDFGAGHSSLQLLVNCKLDAVKIDQTLTHNLNGNERSQSIVRSIINLAETLEIECVAEGIETYEQLHMLRQFNCQNGQGYYFSKPQSPTHIEDLMTTSPQPVRIGAPH